MRQLLISLLVTFLLIKVSTANAQNSVQGVVSEKETGISLPGVNVFVPEINIGTITDEKGFFELENLPAGELILQFSYVGYKSISQSVFIESETNSFDISLEHMAIQGEEVVVSGNFTSTQHDNTIKISTLKIDQISKTSQPSLIGSITKIPGVSMISKGPGVVTPVIRGLSLNNILMLNNGVPLMNYQFSEEHPYLIDENGIDRVEVIKGPASMIYGSGAVGGVINLIAEPPPLKGTIVGNYDLQYYTNTIGVRTNLGIKGNQNGIIWGVRGGLNSHKDYIQGNSQFTPNSRFNRYNLKANAGIIRKHGIFKLNYSFSRNNFGMAVEPAFKLVTENKRKNHAWYQDLTDHLLSSQNRIFIKTVKIDVDFAYQSNNRKLFGNDTDSIFNLVNMDLHTLTYSLKSTQSINEKAKYIVGIQGMYQENENHEAPDRVLPDAFLNDLSAYGLFQYTIGLAKLEAGLRYSYRKINVPYQEAGSGHGHEDEEPGHEDEELEYLEYQGNFDNLSLSLGATLTANEENLLRLNIASAFRAPNLAELTQHGRHGIRYEEGNPNLKTQQNLEFDLGYHFHSAHTTFDISIFYNYIYNYIHLAPTTDTTDDGDKVYRYSQNTAFLFGGEASLHVHPHPIDWLHFDATYSLLTGEYANGNYLPRIPANELNIVLRVEKEKWKAFRNVYLEGGIDFVFAQNNPSEFESTTAGYNLLNAGFGFAIQLKHERIAINITANNLLNINYYNHLSTLQDYGIYNMGRNVMLGIRVPFNIKN